MEDCERCELNWLDGGALLRIVHAPHSEEAVDKRAHWQLPGGKFVLSHFDGARPLLLTVTPRVTAH